MIIVFYLVILFFAIRLLVIWIKNLREDRIAARMEKERITTKMGVNDFWEIIERCKDERPLIRQIGILKSELRKLTPVEIVAFDNRFQTFKDKAYRWDLWGAVYLLCGGCSDDSFEYFREWLIGQGKEKFDNAIKDPESIKDFVAPDDNWEGLGYCAKEIYREKTKKTFAPGNLNVKDEPTGKEWTEEELPDLFPAISKLIK